MVSIIAYYESLLPRGMRMKGVRKIKFSRLLIGLAIILAKTTPTYSQETDGAEFRSSSINKLNIELSEQAQDAINSGVALYFDSEYGIRNSFWLFSNLKARKSHKFMIKRHALSNRYVVKRVDLESPRIFRSIAEAVNYIAAQALMLLESYDDQQNEYSMRLSLSRFDLPGPMRLNAFASTAWRLDTGWITWQSAN
jgi:hypothetical protein